MLHGLLSELLVYQVQKLVLWYALVVFPDVAFVEPPYLRMLLAHLNHQFM